MNVNLERRKQGAMERHIQTMLISLLTAAVIALATFTYQAGQTFARLDERLNTMGRDLSTTTNAIEKLAGAAETKADHDGDMQIIDLRMVDHENRLRRIEEQRR